MMVGGKTPLHCSASAYITVNERNCDVSELVRRLKFYDLIPRVPNVDLFPQALQTLPLTLVGLLHVEKGSDYSLHDTLRTRQAPCLCRKMCKKTHIFEAKH